MPCLLITLVNKKRSSEIEALQAVAKKNNRLGCSTQAVYILVNVCFAAKKYTLLYILYLPILNQEYEPFHNKNSLKSNFIILFWLTNTFVILSCSVVQFHTIYGSFICFKSLFAAQPPPFSQQSAFSMCFAQISDTLYGYP